MLDGSDPDTPHLSATVAMIATGAEPAPPDRRWAHVPGAAAAAMIWAVPGARTVCFVKDSAGGVSNVTIAITACVPVAIVAHCLAIADR